MLYNIYCDESCHLENDRQQAMVLGAIWCKQENVKTIFNEIRAIKVNHGQSPRFNIKWNAISPSGLAFYTELINYFFSKPSLHFRGLVIPDKTLLDHDHHKQTHDDFYYKMYFDMLKVIFARSNQYSIYLDIKDTRSQEKVIKLTEVLRSSQYDFSSNIIQKVQQVRSHEVELVQLTDLLIGAISYINRGLNTSTAKLAILDLIRNLSGYSLTRTTLYKEEKFNLFIWDGARYRNA